MKTITLSEPGSFKISETLHPGSLQPGEALVRVRRVGICGTDIHAYRGRQPFFTYPRILGHELGVEITEIGANEDGLKAGDWCAVEPYLTCGKCVACRRGRTNCCTTLKCLGVHCDGGMREFIHVPIAKLHKSPRLTLEQLALVETLGIGAHAVERGDPQHGEFVLVIGAGPIGLSVIQFLQSAGVKLIVSDVSAHRLAFCKEQFHVPHLLDPARDTAEQLREITGGEMPTLVFDATGNPQSMNAAFKYPGNTGRLVFVGLFQGELTFNDPEFHRRELTILATRNATASTFQRIIHSIEDGSIDTRPWITHRATADEMPAQFESWLKPEARCIKAMVEF